MRRRHRHRATPLSKERAIRTDLWPLRIWRCECGWWKGEISRKWQAPI